MVTAPDGTRYPLRSVWHGVKAFFWALLGMLCAALSLGLEMSGDWFMRRSDKIEARLNRLLKDGR